MGTNLGTLEDKFMNILPARLTTGGSAESCLYSKATRDTCLQKQAITKLAKTQYEYGTVLRMKWHYGTPWLGPPWLHLATSPQKLWIPSQRAILGTLYSVRCPEYTVLVNWTVCLYLSA